jgi:hypothetical protein
MIKVTIASNSRVGTNIKRKKKHKESDPVSSRNQQLNVDPLKVMDPVSGALRFIRICKKLKQIL